MLACSTPYRLTEDRLHGFLKLLDLLRDVLWKSNDLGDGVMPKYLSETSFKSC